MASWAWAYEPEKCDGDFCPHDCDHCEKSDYSIEEEDNILKGGKEIARYLHIGIATFERHRDEIPHWRIGRLIFADKNALDRWKNNGGFGWEDRRLNSGRRKANELESKR